ncbi:hypothetical protein ASF94_15600 [Acidovorax sp. Leaf160]|nr:hypothetical protein ASF94_15600 [Acidovorax sp. Leaf160]
MDNGLIVEVLQSVDNRGWEYLGPCWMVRSLGSPFHMTPTTRSQNAALPDACLRSIRDPGGNAVDETLQRLPAPKREEVAA